MNLVVSLALPGERNAEALARTMYDPRSPMYRHYLTPSQFAAAFGPSPASYAYVVAFFRQNGFGIVETASNRMVVTISGTVAQAQATFHTTLATYREPGFSNALFGPDREPRVNLAIPLLHVSGLDNFAASQTKVEHGIAPPSPDIRYGSGPGGQLLGSDVRSAYYGTGPLRGEGQSVALYEEESFNIDDVRAYFRAAHQSLDVPIHAISVSGTSLACIRPHCVDDESAIDIEAAISMAPRLKELDVYEGSSEKRPAIFNRIAEDDSARQVSCSWGWSDDESALDPIFLEMILQGQSVIVATGDGGSKTPAGSVWPSDDAFVTGAGGTNLKVTGSDNHWDSETAWHFSAGGASKNGILIPAYQLLAVNATNGASLVLRNYPDISAAANNFYSCYENGCNGGNWGTSYAAPEWAGFTALANERAAQEGDPAIGFLNPAIYDIDTSAVRYDDGFHDIVSGNNGAYHAVDGYDLVTGWGSPKRDLIDELIAVTAPLNANAIER